MCLLSVLHSLKDELSFNLYAAHLNHGIRGAEAKRDEDFAKSLAEKLGIKIFIKEVDVPSLSKGKSTEEVAREERYKFFAEIAKDLKSPKIAVAHNKNDLAETVIMRLCRGTSVFGLSGIKERNGNIIRPLINIKRTEIERYLNDNDLSFVIDSTNLTDEYIRNKVRHNILPQMEKINEDYLDNVKNTAERMEKTADFIEKEALKQYGEITDFIDIEKLAGLHTVLAEYVVSKTAYNAGIKEISGTHIKSVLALSNLESGKKVSLSDGYEATKIYEKIVFSKEKVKKTYFTKLEVGDNYISEANYTVTITPSEKGISEKAFPLYARPKKEGDKIKVVGLLGSKKLQNLFIDEKIPLDKRDEYPVIVNEKEVIYCLGRCSENYVTKDTSEKAYSIKIREGV